MKFLKSLFAVGFIVATLAIPAAFTTAAPLTPERVEEQALTGYENNKRPYVAAGANRVDVAWGNIDLAQFAERDEEAGGAFNYATLGSVGSNPTYYNAVVDIGSDGTVHYAWVEGPSTILYRRRAPGQGFSEPVAIAQGYAFAHYPAITVQGSDNVFVSWRSGSDIHFTRSTNGGASWSGVGEVGVNSYGRPPRLASGSSGVYLTWTDERSANVYVGVWNGSNFTPEQATRGGADFEPNIDVGPDGVLHLAFRRIGASAFHAVRQSSGSYATDGQFGDASVEGSIGLAVDAANNVHIAWIGRETGGYATSYSVKKPGENFSAPIVASNDGGAFKANVDLDASSRSGRTVAHMVWESFSGGPAIRYARVQSRTCTAPGTGVTPGPALRNRIYLPVVINGPTETC
ncbi:MAG TPA: hypothetical protein VLA19_19765 [Herpetosiphonaceae bacterium]|nr:hypothetical protein [Herpetosiphonaceae bacterium]